MSEESRQGINKITLVGLVKEQKLNSGSGEKGKYIGGSLVIKTGENSEIELKVMAGEKTKDGTKTKKIYETLQKFIDKEYLTLADCKNDEDKENVAKVRVFGNGDFTPHFKEEIYKSSNTNEAKTRISIDLGFGNVYVDNSIKEEDFKAEFEIELYVTSVTEEEKNEEPTGRAIVSGWTPVYGGKVIPTKVIAGKIIDDDGEDYDFGQDILDQLEEGTTIDVWGDINYKSIITKIKKGGNLGKAKIEEKKEYINELLITGADIIEDEEKEFDGELIKKAKIERDTEIENVKNEESNDNKKGKGLNKNSKSEDKPRRQRPSF